MGALQEEYQRRSKVPSQGTLQHKHLMAAVPDGDWQGLGGASWPTSAAGVTAAARLIAINGKGSQGRRWSLPGHLMAAGEAALTAAESAAL